MSKNGQEQLKRLESLIKLGSKEAISSTDFVTPDELSTWFAGIVESIKTLKDSNDQTVKTIVSHISKIDQMVNSETELTSKQRQNLEKEFLLLKRELSEKVEDIKRGIPKDFLKKSELPTFKAETPESIRNKLETLRKDERLDKKAIKGLENILTQKELDRAISILDQRTQFLINKVQSVADSSFSSTSGQYKIFVTVGSSDADYITDGTADDVQIQAAIDYVAGLGGGTVYLKDAATYDIQSSITVPDNITLGGTKASILKRNASMTSGILIKNSDTISGNSRIKIYGFKVDGSSNLVTPVDGMESLRFDLCTDVKFIDLEVINSPSEGIQFHRGTNCHVISCKVNGTAVISASYKAGIIISGNVSSAEQSTDCSIVDCYTENTSGEGVGSYYSQGTKLNRNTIRWTSGADNKSEILIEQSKDVECLDNTVTSNLDGIICLSSQRVVIAGYNIKSATLNGISIEGSSRDITIGEGTINNVQLHGINLQDTARNISIIGSKIVDAGQAADNTYYAINCDPNGGFLRRITITGTHAYASAANKIKSFIGTTTDVSNQIDGLYERGNFSEGHVGSFRTIDNDIYVDFSENDFINNETDNGLYIEQNGILASNKRTFYVNQVSDLTSSTRAAQLIYTNTAHTGGYLLEIRDDNSSSTLTAVQRLQVDGATTALDIDATNTSSTQTVIDITNAGTGHAINLAQTGILAVNKRALFVNVQSDLTTSGRQGVLFYTNAVNTAGYLFEMRDDNASSTLTAVQRIQIDGIPGSGGLFIDNNNTGRAINVDHDDTGTNPSVDIDRDGNNAGAVTGLKIDVANAGAGAAHAIIVSAGRTGLIQTVPTAYLHLGAGTTAASTAPLKLTTGSLNTTAEIGAVEYNNDFHLTNWKLVRYSVGGTIFEYFTDSTVGGAEADIYTSTTIANTLGTNGDKLVAEYGGNFVTVGTELTQLKVYFAGTAIWDSTGLAPATGTTSWRVYVEIIRVSSTVVRYTVSLNTTGASGYVYCTVGELTGLTLSNTNIIKITGTSSGVGSGSGDIVGKMGYVEFKPAA